MKKSAKVTLAFVSSFAAAVMNGCDSDKDGDWVEAKRCVDNNNVVVEDRLCNETTGRGGGHSGGYYHYYGGRGYYPGDMATDGGRIGQPGISYRSPSHVARGGFGSTGKAFVSSGT